MADMKNEEEQMVWLVVEDRQLTVISFQLLEQAQWSVGNRGGYLIIKVR